MGQNAIWCSGVQLKSTLPPSRQLSTLSSNPSRLPSAPSWVKKWLEQINTHTHRGRRGKPRLPAVATLIQKVVHALLSTFWNNSVFIQKRRGTQSKRRNTLTPKKAQNGQTVQTDGLLKSWDTQWKTSERMLNLCTRLLHHPPVVIPQIQGELVEGMQVIPRKVTQNESSNKRTRCQCFRFRRHCRGDGVVPTGTRPTTDRRA